MKFLALENEVPGIDENRFTQDILRRESAQAWELMQQGIFRRFISARTGRKLLL